MTTQLSSLDVIDVASPCRASWDAMTGDERARFCGQCSKHVYNLSGMSREEAESLVQDTEGSVCVRFYRRADGTVLTADCPVGVWDVRTRLARLWGGVAALIGFLTFGAISWASRSAESAPATGTGPVERLEASIEQPVLVMGKICSPLSPQPVSPQPPVQTIRPLGKTLESSDEASGDSK